jgi:predicted dehydrogenase
MRSKLRIGIVGAGGIVQQRHLPALLALPGVEIVAVSNSTYASSERFCRGHLPSATPFKNWADLVALKDLDIVWIGTPPHMHAPISISALEAGKHVFCQARMAMNLAEAREMLVAAQKRPHLVAMLCPPPHGLTGDFLMRKLLTERRIGTPHTVRLQSLSGAFVNPAAPAYWRQRVEVNGLNVLTLGIYVEVLQRWLGPISAVSAQTKIIHRMRGGYEVRVPDVVNVLAEFASGVTGSLLFSGVCTHAPGDRLEIYGDKGTLHYDFSTDGVLLGEQGSSHLLPVALPSDLMRHWTVEEDFIAAVKRPTLPRPHPTFEDGEAYMRVVQAVADSAACGERVKIGLN